MSDEATTPLSAKQFHALFPSVGQLAEAGFVPALNAACREFAITTPARVAAFLAQCGHESAGLVLWRESFAYKPEGLFATFPKAVGSLERARLLVSYGHEAVAEAVYGHLTPKGQELGNADPGDGYRYRGRGPIQTTGKTNYQRAADVLNLPLLEQPELLEQPGPGFRASALYWMSRGLNDLADKETLDGYRLITRRINPGMLGWDDRLKRLREARAVLGLLPIAGAA